MPFNHQFSSGRARSEILSSRLVQIVMIIFLIAISSKIGQAQGRFDDLLRRLPASTNALMVIDVKAVHNSPLATKEGWKAQHQSTYVKQPIILPPESDRLVLAAQMNPNREFAQAWEGAVISLTEPLSMQSIAKAEGGYADNIGGLKAAGHPATPTSFRSIKVRWESCIRRIARQSAVGRSTVERTKPFNSRSILGKPRAW